MARTKPAEPAPPSIAAWLVHAFTASGAVLAMLALLAVEQQRWTLALAWLALSGIVDGVDGTLARRARVKERLPRIDGDTLDLVIDYLTYVFVPALFIWRAGLVPPGTAPWLAAAILVSSLYVFARTDMKTDDGYFRGFPGLWSVVAFYLYVLQVSPGVGAGVVVLLVIMTFAPIHFVHPFRVRDYGIWLPAISILWIVATCALLWPEWSGTVRFAIAAVSLASAAVLIGMGLLRSLRGR
jgi:phosphatidylcholine synthase